MRIVRTSLLRAFLVLTAAFGLLLPSRGYVADQAVVSLGPGSGTFLVGATFDVSILLDTKGIAVNTVEIELSFPPDKLQLASPSVGPSIIQLWPAPPAFSNREGRIYFVGGIPSPGIVTSRGVVLTLSFRATAPGDAEIRFGDRTKILANDGRGTNIAGPTSHAFYRLTVPPPEGPAISSPTHPDQSRWYRDPNPVFLWSKSQFANGYSFSIDRDPAGFPDTVEDSDRATASYQNLESGVWYFHLRERSGGQWGGVSHYAVKIDVDPPAAFSAKVSPGTKTRNRNPIIRFFTTDTLSGLDRYEIKLISLAEGVPEEALFFEAISPYQFTALEPGRYQVVIRALDRAGNTRDEGVTLTIHGIGGTTFTPEGIDVFFFTIPWFWVFLILAIAAMMITVVVYAAWRHHRKHVERSRKSLETTSL